MCSSSSSSLFFEAVVCESEGQVLTSWFRTCLLMPRRTYSHNNASSPVILRVRSEWPNLWNRPSQGQVSRFTCPSDEASSALLECKPDLYYFSVLTLYLVKPTTFFKSSFGHMRTSWRHPWSKKDQRCKRLIYQPSVLSFWMYINARAHVFLFSRLVDATVGNIVS